MAHRDPQGRRRRFHPRAWGRRTRLLIVTVGLLSAGIPVAIVCTPVSTGQHQRTTRIVDNSAGLGVTGALPDPPGGAPGAVANSIGVAAVEVPPAPPAPAQRPHAIPVGQSERDQAHDAVVGTPPATVVPQPSPGSGSHPAAAAQPGIIVAPHPLAGPLGIPSVMLGAYQNAAQVLAASQPGCHLSWSVLAGIGRIESGHAGRGRVDAAGNTLGRILGARLDGSPGMAAIPDTDHGLLDGDTVWDRAVGPMQFIPSSWRRWGIGNPNNIYDSTLAAGRYLCAAGINLSDPSQLQTAIYRYNHSATYVAIVMQWANAYLTGVVPQPSAPGSMPPGTNGTGGRPIAIDPAPLAATTITTAAPPSPPAATPLPAASPLPTRAPPTPATTTPPATSVAPTPDPTSVTPTPTEQSKLANSAPQASAPGGQGSH